MPFSPTRSRRWFLLGIVVLLGGGLIAYLTRDREPRSDLHGHIEPGETLAIEAYDTSTFLYNRAAGRAAAWKTDRLVTGPRSALDKTTAVVAGPPFEFQVYARTAADAPTVVFYEMRSLVVLDVGPLAVLARARPAYPMSEIALSPDGTRLAIHEYQSDAIHLADLGGGEVRDRETIQVDALKRSAAGESPCPSANNKYRLVWLKDRLAIYCETCRWLLLYHLPTRTCAPPVRLPEDFIFWAMEASPAGDAVALVGSHFVLVAAGDGAIRTSKFLHGNRANVVAFARAGDAVLIGYQSPAMFGRLPFDINRGRGGEVELLDLGGRPICSYATPGYGLNYLAALDGDAFLLRTGQAVQVVRVVRDQ